MRAPHLNGLRWRHSTARSLVLFFATLALGLLAFGTANALAASVSGTVTDAVSGAPLANVWVNATYPNGDPCTFATTDETGAYAVSLPDGTWNLSFSASFHVTEFYNDKPDRASADTITVADEQPITGIDAALARTPQATISGTVVDATNGQPIAGADVEACTVDGDDWSMAQDTATAADGTYSLTVAPGTYGVVINAYGYQWVDYPSTQTAADATLITVNDGDAHSGTDVSLKREAVTMWGVAQDVDGTMLDGIELQVFSAADNKLLRSAASVDGGCSVDLSDLLGQPLKFRLHDPSGEFADYYYDGDATSLDQATVVTPSLGGSYECFTYLYNVHDGEVKGRTLNAKGQPVGGIAVSLSGAGTSRTGGQAVSDADGNYDITGLHVSRATSFIVGFNTGGANRTYLGQFYNGAATQDDADAVSVAPGQVVTVDSHLYKSCSIAGTITDPDGPASGVATTLYDADGNVVDSTPGPWTGNTYSFTNLAPGSYRVGFYDTSQSYLDELRAYHDQFNGGAATLDTAPLIVLDGSDTSAVTVDAHMQPWGGIKVDVEDQLEPFDLIPGATVTLYNASGKAVATAPIDPGYGYDYGYLFSQLALGTYYVGVDDPRGVYASSFYGNVTSLNDAKPIVLTDTTSKASILVPLTPVRGVLPGLAAQPDGSATTPSLRLGISSGDMASSGNTVLILGTTVGSEGGCFVYERGDAGWAQRQLLTLPGEFGQKVAIDGDLAAVAAGSGDSFSPDIGRVYVYRRADDVWSLEATLTRTDENADLGFGASVAVSGDTILVGAPYAKVGLKAGAGAAYVFTSSGGTWSLQTRLTGPAGGQAGFGGRVALDGDRALVSSGGDLGAVTVFERSGTTWSDTGPLTATGLDPVPSFGASLALQGDRALVGATGQGNEAGTVYVFQKQASGWVQTAELTAADGQPSDHFGGALSLQGDSVLVGAPRVGYALTGFTDGAAYLFTLDGATWRQVAEMHPEIGPIAVGMGSSVAIAGRDQFVGAPGEKRSDGSFGNVCIYSPYVTDMNVPLAVDAGRGVLINDVGPEGETLSASLLTGPSHGTLDLAADGSFTYTPATGFAGTDEFTYKATSPWNAPDEPAQWDSDPTTVTITVRGVATPTITARGVPSGWVNVAPTVSLSTGGDDALSAVEYRPGATATWQTYGAPFTVVGQGVSACGARCRDAFGNEGVAAFTIKLDTRRPTPQVRSATVKRGRTCTIRYEVADPRPGSPTATVKIVVSDSHGRRRWARTVSGALVDTWLSVAFRCNLAHGAYQISVLATDTAGNLQTKAAAGKLVVR